MHAFYMLRGVKRAAAKLRENTAKWTVFTFGLKPPSEKEMLADSAGTESWVRSWREASLRDY